MLTRALILMPLAVIATSLTITGQQSSAKRDVKAATQSERDKWPDLDTLKNFRHARGNTCGINGLAPRNSEKARLNRLMNRYHLPEAGFEKFSLQDLLALSQGEISPRGALMNYPASEDKNNNRAVAIVAFVKDVLILGCGARSLPAGTRVPSTVPANRGVESCNCYTNETSLCSAQIVVTTGPEVSTESGHNEFVFEVTERARRLVQEGRLSSNIGNDWRIDPLRKLKGHWVRFSGWLLFDPNYADRAWTVDPEDNIGRSNVRETAWEIHPVMGIEIDPVPPF